MIKTYEIKPTQAPIHAPWTERPCYELQEGATSDEMREMSIRAMRDELIMPWTPNKDFMYQKKAACARAYYFYSNTAYAGLPYTTGGSGFLQWYDMTDPKTGILYDADFENLGYNFGNSCAASVSWGAAAVCASTQRSVSTYEFVPKNGWLPLGEVEVPADLATYRDLGTHEIIAKNGDAKILEGYALAKKGDAVVATANPELGKQTANHCMMLIEDAVVVRNEDGSINAEESKVIVQDQWSRNYDLPSEMQTLLTRGHTDKVKTFEELLRKDKYIALTTAEYLGLKPYEKAKAWLEGGETAETLKNAKICSNYRPAVLILKVLDAQGNVLFEERNRTSGEEAVKAYNEGYDVSLLMTEGFEEAVKKGAKTILVQDIVATGELLTVKTFDI